MGNGRLGRNSCRFWAQRVIGTRITQITRIVADFFICFFYKRLRFAPLYKIGTQMTQIFTDSNKKIRENPRHPRYPRSNQSTFLILNS